METITINGLEWSIEEADYGYCKEAPDALGSTYKDTLRIVLVKSLPLTNFKKILIHELTHATAYSYGFDQVAITDEILCDFMSAYSEQILKVTNDYLEKRNETNK